MRLAVIPGDGIGPEVVDEALKVLPCAMMGDETARARLQSEARTASQFNHPHIAHIYDVGEDGGHLFIAMELVEGRPLRDLIPRGGFPSTSSRRPCPRAKRQAWRS